MLIEGLQHVRGCAYPARRGPRRPNATRVNAIGSHYFVHKVNGTRSGGQRAKWPVAESQINKPARKGTNRVLTVYGCAGHDKVFGEEIFNRVCAGLAGWKYPGLCRTRFLQNM